MYLFIKAHLLCELWITVIVMHGNMAGEWGSSTNQNIVQFCMTSSDREHNVTSTVQYCFLMGPKYWWKQKQ